MTFKLPLFILLTPILSVSAQEKPLITLSAAVESGLKNDPTLQVEAARLQEANSGLSQARLARLGGFRLKGLYTDGTDPVYAFATAMKQGTFSMASLATINNPAPARNYMAGIEAGVPLFTGYAVGNAVKIGNLGVEAALHGYERANAAIMFKITYQWLTVLLREKLAALAADTVKAAEGELNTAQMLKDRGMVPGADYYGAEAILSTLRGYNVQWRKALELEKEKLAIILGIDPTAGPAAAGALTEAAYADKAGNEPAGETITRRRDIKAMGKMADIAAVSETMQKNSALPVIEAFGAWETNSESLSDFRDNRMLGIRLSLALGDPAYFAKKESARAATAMAVSRLSEASRQAAAEVAEAAGNYTSAEETLPVARETLAKARQSLELFRPLYRQGRQSVLEVLRAQAFVMQAEAAYYETIYKIHLYHAQRLLASENLNSVAIAEMSGKLSGAVK